MLALRSLRRSFSSAAGGDLVLFRKEGNIGILTLNQPEKMNALTVGMGEHLKKVLNNIDYETTHGLIITGSKPAFSAGGDFGFLTDRGIDTPSRNSNVMREFYGLFLERIRTVPVPTIAAINGPAVGAGACFALGADLRIMSKTAKIGFTFVGLGLHPGMGSTFNLPKLIGPQRAAKMLLTGELISGEEAARIGLVLEATEEDKVLPTALQLAEKMAAQGPLAVRSCVRSLRMLHDEGMDRALWREADSQACGYNGPDYKEGLAATAGKRKPAFKQHESYQPALKK